ncbi:NUDIX domain-containing protein [Nocardioides sp.]|jgi:8-oxo-dGTP pyrophosphatase MutT (NUDIX family)/phosphohistidine phosphatase SixA|uniref:NUDIX hydrolase n=1 Tax=Nocardioides sp. TaxID=35761 RepID=UPI002637D995|nr:NUDIX domain-containing protein [Nocardioides sp.]
MASQPRRLADVVAAGAVVFRPGREVLLVHRSKYDDWSFPKGKLDPREHATTAAVREVMEETGLHVRLGPPLTTMRYENAGRMKTVHYWQGRVVGDDDVTAYEPNAEIDRVAWVPAAEALERLSYARDRALLEDALTLRKPTQALVVLRHGQARSRKAWRGEDRARPLLRSGMDQAFRLVPVLAAYDVERVVSSGATRCDDTVGPYVETVGLDLEVRPELSEEGNDPARVTRTVRRLAEAVQVDRGGAVLCSHRPVLPGVFAALGLPDPGLEPGEMVVVHLRRGRVVATEQHLVG